MSKFWRYMRIAFSGTCVIVAVLLCVLWVRSYTWSESYYIQGSQNWYGGSDLRGCIILNRFNATKPTQIDAGYGVGHAPGHRMGDIREPFFGFAYKYWVDGADLVVPMWFLIVTSVSIASAPWFRWRFTIRTVLIATALFAVLLGLIVWLSGGELISEYHHPKK